MSDRLEELRRRHAAAEAGGGEERRAKMHAEGRLSARERLDLLLDEGTFVETDKLVRHRCTDFGMDQQITDGDGFITGHGLIHGRSAFVFAQDFTVLGGSLSETNAKKIVKIMDLAMKTGAPVIGLNDSGGARIQEGVLSLGGYADIFLRNTLGSGVVPQISAIMGPCAGGAVYSPALTDFTFMVDQSSYMFVTGPDVIKTVTHEDVTKEDLGGAMTHNSKSGVAHFLAHGDAECLQLIRELMTYLPQNNRDDVPRVASIDPVDREDAALDAVVPPASNVPYDMKDVIRRVVDHGKFFEVQEHWARNMVVGFARMDGRSVGVVANQPAFLAGCLDIDSDLRGCSRFPAGYGAGMGRHHPAWSETALRLRGGDRAENHRDHAKGLRGGILCDGIQTSALRCEPGVAERGDRGDGSRRGCEHRLSPRDRRGSGSGIGPAGKD
jgi:propionyl-CoA carboxylase beta chain